MAHTASAGAAGSGFISGTSPVLLILVIVVALAAIGPVRDAAAAYMRGLVGYFNGPSETAPQAAAQERSSASTDAEEVTAAGRASDRDVYDFDLTVLAHGDRQNTDAT